MAKKREETEIRRKKTQFVIVAFRLSLYLKRFRFLLPSFLFLLIFYQHFFGFFFFVHIYFFGKVTNCRRKRNHTKHNLPILLFHFKVTYLKKCLYFPLFAVHVLCTIIIIHFILDLYAQRIHI